MRVHLASRIASDHVNFSLITDKSNDLHIIRRLRELNAYNVHQRLSLHEEPRISRTSDRPVRNDTRSMPRLRTPRHHLALNLPHRATRVRRGPEAEVYIPTHPKQRVTAKSAQAEQRILKG